MMKSDSKHDLLIIGAGPAGVGAAIQARMMGQKLLLLEKDEVGGRLALARRLDNFRWGRRSLGGDKICQDFRLWLEERKIALKKEQAIKIDFRTERFEVETRSGEKYFSKAVIVATGVGPRAWRVSGVSKAGARIFYGWRQIPWRDGDSIVIIGGGETAFDQALSLTEGGARVRLFMRGDRPRAYPGLMAEARRKGVEIYSNISIKSVALDRDQNILLDAGSQKFSCCYLLPAVGHRPQLPEIEKSARQRLNRGLWLAGDVREKYCRQAAVAFGDGVRAAMLACDFLQKRLR